jgi:hypothetical protein
MSRSNPYKKKRRAAKKTILIYGEGQSDECFLKLLRKLFAQNSGAALTVKKGNGGIPKAIVEAALKYAGDFDRRIVVIDNDKSKKEMTSARNLAKEYNVDLIENTPCLEGLLLSILEIKTNYKSKTSAWCKREFEKKYVSKKQRADIHHYEQLFSKEKLENKKNTIPELKKLITLMEGKL